MSSDIKRLSDIRLQSRVGAGLAVALALVTPGTATMAVAQSAQELDAGRFEIRLEGQRVGVESFRIWREGGETKAVGQLTYDESPAEAVDVRLQGDQRFRPTRYGLRSPSGPVSAVDGAWNGDRLRLHIVAQGGERWKEFMTPGRVAILEDGVAHHLYLLLSQLGDNPTQAAITVLVPSEGTQTSATLRSGGEETVRIGGQALSARRFDVELGETRLQAWRAADGRLLRVAWPEMNRTAVRLPEEG
jgi:hypothetical protein